MEVELQFGNRRPAVRGGNGGSAVPRARLASAEDFNSTSTSDLALNFHALGFSSPRVARSSQPTSEAARHFTCMSTFNRVRPVGVTRRCHDSRVASAC